MPSRGRRWCPLGLQRRRAMKTVDANIRELDSAVATSARETRGRRSKAAPHSTPAESAARGKAARDELRRSAHAHWEPAPMRRDPVDLLEQQAQTRLPELGPIRYGRMLVS